MDIRASLNDRKNPYIKKARRNPRPAFNSSKYKDLTVCFENRDVENRKKLQSAKEEKLNIDKFRIIPTYKITINQNIVGSLNYKFTDLYNTINQSKYILDFKDNWDANGSKAYSANTWIKATRFLIKFYMWRDQNSKPLVKPPKIYQGPEGSIDIYWKSSTFTYLINIPEAEELISYYYKSPTGTVVEGEFDLRQFRMDELQEYFEPSFL